MKHVQNYQKSRQVSSAPCGPVAQDHFQVPAWKDSFGQGIANNFTKTWDQKSAMTLLVALVALGAFIYSLKGYDLQMKTMKAVKKHLDESGRTRGQKNEEP